MNSLLDMLWVETRKALRSRMPLWTGIGMAFMPLGMAFLLYAAMNPEISHKLGLISAKADLMKYAATDWNSYLTLLGQMVAAGGFFFFVLAVSWVFGREFADGTVKDLLAVPVSRSALLLAKFLTAAIWSTGLTGWVYAIGMGVGAAIGLPGASAAVLLHGSLNVWVTALLTMALALPFAFPASAGRGYLLPVGAAVLLLMAANFVIVAGWGAYFPWSVAGLYSQGSSGLPAVSYWLVFFTALAGMAATDWWWKNADQSR